MIRKARCMEMGCASQVCAGGNEAAQSKSMIQESLRKGLFTNVRTQLKEIIMIYYSRIRCSGGFLSLLDLKWQRQVY